MESLTKIEVAGSNTILNFFILRGEFITHMELQKILYFSAGHCLAKNNMYIAEHNFEAWPYGPVLPRLYNEMKKYGNTKIERLITFDDGVDWVYSEGVIFESIMKTISKLKHLTAWELSEMSHAIDGPWFVTVRDRGYREEIKPEEIKKYFIDHPL